MTASSKQYNKNK